MTRARIRFALLAAIAGIAAVLPAAAAPIDTPIGSEDAFALLDPGGEAPVRRGAWGSLAAVAREALPGASAWRLDLGLEPGKGLGGGLGLGILGGLAGSAILDADGAVVIRRGSTRGRLGAGVTRRGSAALARLVAEIAVAPDPAVLAALDVAVFPGERGGAPDPRVVLAAAADPWMARVEVANDLETGFGVRVAPGLWWSARMTGVSPAMGLRWRAGAVEFSAQEERHPHLGRITRVAIAWGGRRP